MVINPYFAVQNHFYLFVFKNIHNSSHFMYNLIFFKFDASDMSGAITRIDNAQIAAFIPFWKQENMSTISI